MLTTLKRDWWKLIGVLVLGGGVVVLTELWTAKGWAIAVFALVILNYVVTQLLPTFIHEQKALWGLGCKYLVWLFVCEALLFALTEANISYALLKWPFFIVINTLFLGFLCAAANNTGFWAGIKILLSKHLLKWFIALIIIKLALLLGSLWAGIDFANGMWTTAIDIVVVYICLPLFKQKAK